MKLTAREDLEAPIAEVWSVLVDFDMFETAALRRGAQVTRKDRGGHPAWQAEFTFRGKRRQVLIGLDRLEKPAALGFSATGKAVEAEVLVDLVELGPQRTRMSVVAEMRPRTLAARLFLQSLKLAKGRVTRRYQQGIAQFANMVEARSKGRSAGF